MWEILLRIINSIEAVSPELWRIAVQRAHAEATVWVVVWIIIMIGVVLVTLIALGVCVINYRANSNPSEKSATIGCIWVTLGGGALVLLFVVIIGANQVINLAAPEYLALDRLKSLIPMP